MKAASGAASARPASVAPPCASSSRKASTVIERYVARAKKLKVGNGLDETTEMGPAINEKQLQTDLSYVEIGKNEGAKLLCGGNRLDKGDYQYGWFMQPTVFSDVDPKMRIAQEEIFGPVVSIIPCDDLEDAIEIANGIEYGLSSALYTKDVNKAFAAIRDLYAGITYINAPAIGAEVHLPFGGTKATGNGHHPKAASAPSTSTLNGNPSTSITPTSCSPDRSSRLNGGQWSVIPVVSNQ